MKIHTRIRRINLSRKRARCPYCGGVSKRHSTVRRRLHEVGVSSAVVLDVALSRHYCTRCRKHFSLSIEHLAPPRGQFTHRVRRAAVALVIARGLTLGAAEMRMRQRYFVHVPATTLHGWVLEALAA